MRVYKISLTIPMVSGFCLFMSHTLLAILVSWYLVYLVTRFCASDLLKMKQCEVCKKGHTSKGNEECNVACRLASDNSTCIHEQCKKDKDMFVIHIFIIE